MNSDSKNLLERLRAFREAREWKQFHTPRNLATALAAETGELLEIFRWKLDQNLSEDEKAKIKSEIADVYVFLLYLCDSLGLDLENAANEKMDLNENRYSVEKSKGKATKYTEL